MLEAERISIRWFGLPKIEIGGDDLPLERRKSVGLLAYLSLSSTPISRDVLASIFWPQSQRGQALANLRRVFFSLNHALPDVIRVDRKSAEFQHTPSIDIDVLQFEAIVRDSADLPAAERIDALRRALSLYRGEFLGGLALPDSYLFETWQAQKSVALREQAHEVHQQLVAELFASKRRREAIQAAHVWLAFDPDREEPYRALMYLHAAVGKTQEAMVVYEQCCAMLAGQLGAEPELETDRLRRAIIGGLTLPATEGLPMLTRTLRTVFRAVPTPPHAIIGREAALQEIVTQLSDPYCRLLTIKGMGGVGKSALAFLVAAELKDAYRDGVIYADFRTASAEKTVNARLLTAIGLSSMPHVDDAQQVISFLSGRHALLLIDNFSSQQVNALTHLLESVDNIDVLLTARWRLGTREEWLYELGGVCYERAPSEAFELFMQRSQRLGNRTRWSQAELDAIDEICRYVEGLPLAIELAAEWARSVSPVMMAAELRDGGEMNELLSERGDQHIFEQSWDRLPLRMQRTLRQLALFDKPFSRHAARAVAGANLQQLVRLADCSLLLQMADGCWRLHPLIRHHALIELNNLPSEQLQTLSRMERFAANRPNHKPTLSNRLVHHSGMRR